MKKHEILMTCLKMKSMNWWLQILMQNYVWKANETQMNKGFCIRSKDFKIQSLSFFIC